MIFVYEPPGLPLPFIRRKHRKKDLASPRFLSSRLWTIIATDADAFRLHLPHPIRPFSLPFHPSLSASSPSFLEVSFFLPSSFFVPGNCSGCEASLRATTGQPRRHASGRDGIALKYSIWREERVEIFVAVVLLQPVGGPFSVRHCRVIFVSLLRAAFMKSSSHSYHSTLTND